ncbi:replicative DNA helicase [Criblamydia sequanensis]|uniref:Replicative DNA helicase n=1 Tax=Candidatus Criblamydia sequanensis CRIB-18 TaxID=1437425 RepID=A0A090D287_9BACT|nr:replicative DNA helicase [Criblamydia sequanensis]CDR34430.1 Replicative DNA helicase [Criblamydia sequanensis CRIB-18]
MSENVKVRIPPNSKDSEMMVLGCMLTSVNALNISSDSLDESDFYYVEHKLIFQTLKSAYRMDKPADVHLISEELKRQSKLESIGGVGFLTALAQYAGTSAHIEEYVRLVKDKAILRRMIQASQEIEKKALQEPEDVSSTLDEAQGLFFQIGQSANQKTGKLLADILAGVRSESAKSFLKELEEKQERYQLHGPEQAGITGIRTHLADVDKLLNGFNNSNLMILAARPAMGKTALAINIAENISVLSNTPVGIFSLEMSAEQLVHRIVCSRAQVESEKIKTGSLNGIEYQRVLVTVGELEKHVMVIDDQPGLKVTDLRSRARRMKETHNIGFLVIDYLQLISGSARAMENRQIEISEISRMLKNLARELDIPILCLSQLSRKVEERAGHRPMMSDLRESGSIEQDADIVMFLLRREYYDPNDKPGQAELIIGKNRHGPVGTIPLTYRKEFAQFANYSPLKPSNFQVNDPERDEAFSHFSPN